MATQLSKSQLVEKISTATELSKRDVKNVMDTLVDVGHKELKKNGVFLVPGFAKFVVVKKPATKARKSPRARSSAQGRSRLPRTRSKRGKASGDGGLFASACADARLTLAATHLREALSVRPARAFRPAPWYCYWRRSRSGGGMIRLLVAAGLVLGSIGLASAQTTLRVGDQKGNSQAVMEAAGVLKDVPYKIEWKEFPAAAPLLEALSAGAIETGLVGDAPFTFAAAANVPVKAIAAVRQSREGLAILVSEQSAIKNFDDLRGKKIATGRGSIGHQLILAAVEERGWKASDVQIVFLAPSDAKVAYSQGSVDAWSTWEPYVSQEEVLFKSRRIKTAEGITPGIGFQVASPAAISGKRAELEDFVRRLAVARAWSQGNVASYAETWGKLMNIPPAVPLNWLTRAKIRIVPIDDAVVADEQKTIDLYFRSGLIKHQLNASDIVDRSFSEAISKGAGP
jgi:sulfonate transport system substrate-binding protein